MEITKKGIAVASAAAAFGVAAEVAAIAYQAFYLAASLFIVFTLLFAFSALFAKSGAVAYSASLVPFGTAIFFLPKTLETLAVLLIACVFGILSCWLIRNETETNISSHTHRPLRVGLPMFFTAAAILVSLFYYIGAKEDQYLVLIPKKAFDLVLPYIVGPLVRLPLEQATTFDPNERVDALLEKLLKAQAAADGGNGEPVVSPPETRQYYIEAQRTILSDQLGVKLNGDEHIGDVFYDLINEKALALAGPYVRFMGVLLAASLFFGLKAASILVYWLTIALMPMLVWIARRISLLEERSVAVTVLRLSL